MQLIPETSLYKKLHELLNKGTGTESEGNYLMTICYPHQAIADEVEYMFDLQLKDFYDCSMKAVVEQDFPKELRTLWVDRKKHIHREGISIPYSKELDYYDVVEVIDNDYKNYVEWSR